MDGAQEVDGALLPHGPEEDAPSCPASALPDSRSSMMQKGRERAHVPHYLFQVSHGKLWEIMIKRVGLPVLHNPHARGHVVDEPEVSAWD